MTPTNPNATSTMPRTPAPVLEPTHPCARCGAPVGPGVGLCEECNPLGLRDVASSQVHGTVFIGIIVGIGVLLLLARLAIAGMGPFPATVDGVVAADGGLAVSITVANDGTAAGQTTCRVTDPRDRGTSQSAFVLSPRIEAGGTVSFTSVVTAFGAEVRPLDVSCRTP